MSLKSSNLPSRMVYSGPGAESLGRAITNGKSESFSLQLNHLFSIKANEEFPLIK